jgi:hypothetical protein
LEYSINGGIGWQTSATFSAVTPGNYNIAVRLQAQPTCSTNYAGNPITINAVPVAPAITAPTVTQPTCAVPTGTIQVNATGSGTLEYSLNGGAYQTSNLFASLVPGNYNISVRLQSQPNCATNYSNNPVVINAVPGAPVVSAPTVTQPDCAVSTGSILINASGSGTLEYSLNGGAFGTVNPINNLIPGNYNIAVRLQAQPTCVTNYSGNPVVINTAPAAPVITTPTVVQPTCAVPTGTITVNATGAGTLEYAINGGAYQVSNVFAGLAAGPYNITVRLQAQPTCVTAYSGNPVIITAVPSTPVIASVISANATCSAPNTGQITINASGAGTIEYSIDNGTTWQAGSTFAGLSAGSYTVAVRLQSNPTCVTPYASNPVVILSGTTPIISAVTVVQETCTGLPHLPNGSITVTASGPVNIQYSINNGTSWQNNGVFNNLSAGSYMVMVRDMALPVCAASYPSNPVVLNPLPTTETNCNDGIDDDCDGFIDCLDPDCQPNLPVIGH